MSILYSSKNKFENMLKLLNLIICLLAALIKDRVPRQYVPGLKKQTELENAEC